jgi:hypothetical protein
MTFTSGRLDMDGSGLGSCPLVDFGTGVLTVGVQVAGLLLYTQTNTGHAQKLFAHQIL